MRTRPSVGALGGRAAEEVIYGDVTTGAENDMDHASPIAREGYSAVPGCLHPAPGQEALRRRLTIARS